MVTQIDVLRQFKQVLRPQCRSKKTSIVGTSGSIQWGEYPSVEACVRTWAFFDGSYYVIEGYPFVWEQAASVIIGESKMQCFIGDVTANVIGQSVVILQRDFVASWDFSMLMVGVVMGIVVLSFVMGGDS